MMGEYTRFEKKPLTAKYAKENPQRTQRKARAGFLCALCGFSLLTLG
jgi:hypothetical protein